MLQCHLSGCPEEAVKGGRCAKHAKVKVDLRGTRQQKGYDSWWERIRLVVLERDLYLCRECQQHGVITSLDRSAPVDHIIPISDKPAARLDMANLRALCRACHEFKHRRAAEPGWKTNRNAMNF